MNSQQLYRLELDDMATPAFTSFGKYYYGRRTLKPLSSPPLKTGNAISTSLRRCSPATVSLIK